MGAPTVIGLSSKGLLLHDNRGREAIFGLEMGNSRVTIVEDFHEARYLPVVVISEFEALNHCSISS